MTKRELLHRDRLQARIDAAIAGLRYSPYLNTYGADLQRRFEHAAAEGGLEGVERALDEFDMVSASEDPARARYALYLTLLHHPGLEQLGLSVPKTPERP